MFTIYKHFVHKLQTIF